MQTIADVLASSKAQTFALVGILFLTAVAAFGLGRLSRVPEEPTPVVVGYGPVERVNGEEAPESAAPSSLLAKSPSQPAALEQAQVAGAYVASKQGKVYHLPWCAGAQRINENNKVWFSTKSEAEQAGYRPASNCKGI